VRLPPRCLYAETGGLGQWKVGPLRVVRAGGSRFAIKPAGGCSSQANRPQGIGNQFGQLPGHLILKFFETHSVLQGGAMFRLAGPPRLSETRRSFSVAGGKRWLIPAVTLDLDST